ncbi:MAG: sugar ABC transporter permease [Clostridia bacterium]|nr:sugar ABC transporter permease [Clostridia bacterium]
MKKDAKKKIKEGALTRKNGLYGWFFIAPFVIGFLLIYVSIIANSFWFSLNDIKLGNSGYELSFVGLSSYKYALFTHATFVRDTVSLVGNLLLQSPAIIIFSLFIAVILNQKMPARGLFRAIFFLPVVMATGIVLKADMSNAVLESMGSAAGIETGATLTAGGFDISNVKIMLQEMYIPTEAVDYIVNLVNNIYSVVNYSGVQIILFLSGLQGISPAVYESARVEGANGWESFWKITVPLLSPIILVNIIYTVIDGFTRSDNQIMALIDDVAFSKMNYSASSAMAWLYLALVMVILGVVAFICYRFTFYQERD